jgi:hypothetical protein
MPSPLAGVFGLPSPAQTLYQVGGLAWTATSGSPVTTPVGYPRPGSLVFLASYANQFSTSVVTGLSAMWVNVGHADIFAGNYMASDLWMGWVNAFPGDRTVTTTWTGSNSQGIAVMNVSAARRPRLLASTSATHSGSGTLTLPTISSPGSLLAVASFQTRSGTVPLPAGWTSFATGAQISGVQYLAYQALTPGQSVSLVWTGATDNSGSVLALIG